MTCGHCGSRDEEQAFSWSCLCISACETPWCPMALEAEDWRSISVPRFQPQGGNHVQS